MTDPKNPSASNNPSTKKSLDNPPAGTSTSAKPITGAGQSAGQNSGQSSGQSSGKAASHTPSSSAQGGATADKGLTRDTAKQAVSDAAEEAKSHASNLADKARDEARTLAGDAKSMAHDRAESYKNTAANEAGKVADALRKASDDLRDGSPQERAVSEIAAGLAGVADTIRDRDISDLITDATDFARRNPAAFLGGAALLGFAASRFAKASGSNSDGTGYQSRRTASQGYQVPARTEIH
ncbi:hypothetical protein BV394_12440 [Brevirhabdus pacifica]|uniref:Uncharacterized protein n=1 Tax=Brevirhabdus pacifica TaxID=1267768 RepID=A0A1U7DKC2_9RHOB|nr:hypothetical protein [Brevirhabdus pacifica]APX90436.1 hypothetical protein BV394_12440 [Brevirhabdus pacifica]PJJ85466.1 hypothetical protein CLV77_2336 [Brevirhabdus pacifica]